MEKLASNRAQGKQYKDKKTKTRKKRTKDRKRHCFNFETVKLIQGGK